MSRYIEDAELDNWFGYHPPSSDDIAAGHDFVRRECRELAGMLNQVVPEGSEKTLALRKVREAAMWANAAIACKQEIGERPWVARPVSITVTTVEAPAYVDLRTSPEFIELFAGHLAATLVEAAQRQFGPMNDSQKDDYLEAINLALRAANDELDAKEGTDADTV